MRKQQDFLDCVAWVSLMPYHLNGVLARQGKSRVLAVKTCPRYYGKMHPDNQLSLMVRVTANHVSSVGWPDTSDYFVERLDIPNGWCGCC